MIKVGDNYYRNLEEQVLKNKEDIARHYEIDRALANLGIKIVGQVLSELQLPDPDTYTGSYGDAYAVGIPEEVNAGTSSYSYFVYTRPDINAGHIDSYWLDVGKISIAGPQGPQGVQGEPGESTQWYVFDYGFNTESGNYNAGDMALERLSGSVYRHNGTKWETTGTTLRGPTGMQGLQGPRGLRGEQGVPGPQGVQGLQGEAGKSITIIGILNESNALPLPSELNNLGAAYLVGTSPNYNLWVQVGTSPANAVWVNTGGLGGGTSVSVNGQLVSTWNSDTKLDKKTNTTGYSQVYVKGSSGNQLMLNLSNKIGADSSSSAIPTAAAVVSSCVLSDKTTEPARAGEKLIYGAVRNSSGTSENQVLEATDNIGLSTDANKLIATNENGIVTAALPQASDTSNQYRVIPKAYADNNFVKKSLETTPYKAGKAEVYGCNYNGSGVPSESTYFASASPDTYALARYTASKTLRTEMATTPDDKDCVNVAYLNANISKHYRHTITTNAISLDGGDEIVGIIIVNTNPDTITQIDYQTFLDATSVWIAFQTAEFPGESIYTAPIMLTQSNVYLNGYTQAENTDFTTITSNIDNDLVEPV